MKGGGGRGVQGLPLGARIIFSEISCSVLPF